MNLILLSLIGMPQTKMFDIPERLRTVRNLRSLRPQFPYGVRFFRLSPLLVSGSVLSNIFMAAYIETQSLSRTVRPLFENAR